jgi:hypothetical protein
LLKGFALKPKKLVYMMGNPEIAADRNQQILIHESIIRIEAG